MTLENSPIEQKVMAEINSGRVRLRSKYIYLAEKLGFASVFIFTVLLAVLFFCLVLFYLKTSDNLNYLSFGSCGLLAFFESFPYLLVITFVLLVFIAGFIMKKMEISYKKPFSYLALGLAGVVILFGSALAFTDVADHIEEVAYQGHPAGRLFKPFFRGGLDERNRGLAGRVLAIEGKQMAIQTPRVVKIINVSRIENKVLNTIYPNMFILAIGEMKKGVFLVEKIKLIDPEEIPMTLRGIDRQFSGQTPPVNFPF